MRATPVGDALGQRARERPDGPAVAGPEGTLTWRELQGACAARADRFGDLRPGTPVVHPTGNTVDDIVTLLGLACAGAEVFLVDPTAKAWELDRLRERFPGPPSSGHQSEAERRFALSTSGVGGRAKVVARSWAASLANATAFADALSITAEDAVLCSTPLHHSYALSAGLLVALSSGAALVLPRLPPSPADLDASARRWGVTVLLSVPFLYRWLLAGPRPPTPSLKTAVSAGDRLPADLRASWKERFAFPLRNHYGTTETGMVAVDTGVNRDPGCVGRPLPGIEVEADGRGPVLVRAAGQPGWYHGDEALSRSAFRDGWFDTGDDGRIDGEGLLCLTGRRGARIHVAGRKVDPAEVEDAILQLASVEECAVVGRVDDATGESVWAFVVPKADLTPKALRAHLATRLSGYKLPSVIRIVDSLPKTASGKVRRGLLDDATELTTRRSSLSP